MGKPVTKYTQSTLIQGEKIIHAAKIHNFAFFIPVMTIIFGIILLLIPFLFEKYEEYEKKKKLEEREKIRALYIENQKRARQGLPPKKRQEKAEFADQAGFFSRIWDNTRFWFTHLVSQLPPEMINWLKEANKIRQRIFGVLFIMIGTMTLINTILKKISTEMCITNKKVIFKKGFIQVDETEIPLNHIEGVKAFQTVVDRIIGRGDVLVNGVGMEQIEIKKIVDPNKFRNVAYSAVDKYGHR